MKSKLTVILVVLTVLVLVAGCTPDGEVTRESAQPIIDKMNERWSAVTDLKMEVVTTGPENDQPDPDKIVTTQRYTYYFKSPDKSRFENGLAAMEPKLQIRSGVALVLVANDGSVSYSTCVEEGLNLQDRGPSRYVQDNLRKRQFFFVGEAKVGSREAFKVELVRDERTEGYLYFDKESYFPIRDERFVTWSPGVTITTTTDFTYTVNPGLADALFSVEEYKTAPAGPQC